MKRFYGVFLTLTSFDPSKMTDGSTYNVMFFQSRAKALANAQAQANSGNYRSFVGIFDTAVQKQPAPVETVELERVEEETERRG